LKLETLLFSPSTSIILATAWLISLALRCFKMLAWQLWMRGQIMLLRFESGSTQHRAEQKVSAKPRGGRQSMGLD
jgi:hypothetical protein